MKPCSRAVSYSIATTVVGGVIPVSVDGLYNRPVGGMHHLLPVSFCTADV